MDLKNKIIYAHKGFLNRESEKIYRENSLEACKVSGAHESIQGIELDIRKSKDGILYSYHGTLLQYCITLKFRRDFFLLKEKYRVATLKDIVNVISKDKTIFLDIKDTTITREDILKVMAGKKFEEVVLGNKSVHFLNRFYDMPDGFVKWINGNIFSAFYSLKKLKENNYKYFEMVVPFLVTKKLVQKVGENGLEFFGIPKVVYLREKSYWKNVRKYGIKYISSDFI